MESKKLEYVHEFMQKEPIIQKLTGGDLSQIPLYRWRHIRDYTLRIDDGRFGYPCMCLALDHAGGGASSSSGGTTSIRQEMEKGLLEDVELASATTAIVTKTLEEEQLEYLIRSERVIATGPLHVATETKDDPQSVAVGDLILFNAKDRTNAIELAEGLPRSKEGLYEELRVHFYNTLDVTGKFVSEDPLAESPCADMKEAMEYWGYPVEDNQTPWLNC